MESFPKNVIKRSLIKFLITGSLISFALIAWKIHINNSNELIVKLEIKNRLMNESNSLISQLDFRIEKLIDEVLLLPTPKNEKNYLDYSMHNFTRRNKAIFSIQFYTPDGSLLYSSINNKIDWQSNLFNRSWYRELIKSWKPVISEIYQSPISPFPKVIAVAVPITVADKINGFWLISLDITKIHDLIPKKQYEIEEASTIWFDRSGKIIQINSSEKSSLTSKVIYENNWWHTINELENDSLTLPTYLNIQNEETVKYFYAKTQSRFGQIECLLVQPELNPIQFYDTISSRTSILFITSFLFILFACWIIVYQYEQGRLEKANFSNQTNEFYNTNDLLNTRTRDLENTNEKLNKLTTVLSEQKEDLQTLNNKLQRLQKYLNFLTVPVITLNEDFKVDFINRATETELDQSFEKISGKKLSVILKLNANSVNNFLRKIKSKLNRSELNITLDINEKEKKYLMIGDYLELPDWSGYILTLTDLTELLNLQHDISAQNSFLNFSSRLINSFLDIDNDKTILKNSLSILKEYTNAKCVLFYHYENDLLVLEEYINGNKKTYSKELNPQESITFNTLKSGQPLLIKNKLELPENISIAENKWIFNSAIFNPLVINKIGKAVVVILDPQEEIFNEYSTKFIKLFNQFEVGFHSYLSNIEIKKKNKELDESSRFRSQLLQSITHGFNTPLSTIQGFIKLVEMKFSSFIHGNTELEDYIKKLHEATENIICKSETYLDLARYNRNGLKLNEQESSILDFIQIVEKNILREAKSRNINIHLTQIISENISFMIDFKRIKNSVHTILLNALKYAPYNDNVHLRFMTTDTHLLIDFEDHGPVIKSKNVELIGSEFLPQSLNQERIHFDDDLSMSLAVKMIKFIQGDLTISSNNKLTIHTITIPLKEKKVYEKTA
jgi:signal transduction histidine kinase